MRRAPARQTARERRRASRQYPLAADQRFRMLFELVGEHLHRVRRVLQLAQQVDEPAPHLRVVAVAGIGRGESASSWSAMFGWSSVLSAEVSVVLAEPSRLLICGSLGELLHRLQHAARIGDDVFERHLGDAVDEPGEPTSSPSRSPRGLPCRTARTAAPARRPRSRSAPAARRGRNRRRRRAGRRSGLRCAAARAGRADEARHRLHHVSMVDACAGARPARSTRCGSKSTVTGMRMRFSAGRIPGGCR